MLLRHEGFRRLCRARDLLRESRETSPTIAQLAREVGISPYHFIRQFDALFGLTPHQYRIASRIERAKLLLARDDHSVTDICMDLGFSSLGSFSTLFSQRVGETPSGYRRRIRPLVSVPRAHFSHPMPGCLSLMAALPVDLWRHDRRADNTGGAATRRG